MIKNAKILGRYLKNNNDEILHIWSGSGIEFSTDSSSLIVQIFTKYSQYEIWITVEVNGATILRTMLLPGINNIPVYKNLSNDEKRTIRIVKDSQADLDTDSHYMCIKNLIDFDGNPVNVFEVPEKKISIEFIGDSLTTGEGLRGAKEDLDFSCCYMNFEHTFAKLAADYFDADYSVISQCGYGISCGWNNDPRMKLSNIYKFTDGKSIEYDFKKEYDFVVINLGTNDNGAFNMPPFEGNKITEEDFIEKGKFFLSDCLIKNPKAHIIWMIGMCEVNTVSAIKKIVSSACEINRVSFIKVPSCDDIDYGSRQHPGIKTHREAARHLINKINEIIK